MRIILKTAHNSDKMPIAQDLQVRLEELILGQQDYRTKLILLRQILERLYKELCKDEGRTFSGLFPRMQFVHEKTNLNPDLNYQANHLRITCNRAAHDDMDSGFEPAFKSGVLVIVQLLESLLGQKASESIEDFLKANKVANFIRFKDTLKTSFVACVNAWKRTEMGLCLYVITDNGLETEILLKDDNKSGTEGRIWSKLDKVLWQYCQIRFVNLSQSSSNQDLFVSNPLSQVIVEPDFLLDASAIADCIHTQSMEPQFFFLNKLVAEPVNEKVMLGNLVNQLFDQMVFYPQMDFYTQLTDLQNRSPIAFAALGEATVDRIMNTIKERHFPQLKKFSSSLGEAELLVEPSFICPDYGLQGRLDLLYYKDAKISIIELKSGKAPKKDTWRAHQMQVTAYNMILKSIFGESVLSSSAILYSSEEDNSVRNVESHVMREQELMLCRNRIIGIMHQLMEEPEQFLRWIKETKVEYTSPVLNKKMQQVQTALNRLQDWEFEWFSGQVRAIIREIWSVKIGSNVADYQPSKGFNSLWQDDLASKLASYSIISGLTVDSCDLFSVLLSLPKQALGSDFREGDVVVLYRMDRPVTKQQLLRGSLLEINDKYIRLSIRGGLRSESLLAKNTLWAIEHDILDSLLYNPLASVYTLIEADSDKRARIIGVKPPRGRHLVYESDQSSVCKQLLDTTDYCVVQGPPGTGKTSGLLMNYIREKMHSGNDRMLILSFTNRAVDEICINLDKLGLNFLRTGHSQGITNALLSELVHGKKVQAVKQLLSDTRIWLATTHSANSWLKDALTFLHFEVLIVDEASQIIEASLLGFISEVDKTILIGDQNQLPPIVQQTGQNYSFRSEELIGLCYSGIDRSLMERLYLLSQSRSWNWAFNMLSVHYRMHEEIAELIVPFYENKLKSGTERQIKGIGPAPDMSSKVLSHRIIWIDYPLSTDNKCDSSMAESVLSIINHLDLSGEINDFTTDIGVIAPFRAMIQMIRVKLPERFARISIDTVERYQGSQRKNIILAIPLKSIYEFAMIESRNKSGSVDRKLNVALSRASDRLIILANSSLCSYSEHYRQILTKIKHKHSYIVYNELKEYL